MDMRIWWLQGRSASGDDDIDHRRPQELQISSIIDKAKGFSPKRNKKLLTLISG